MDEGRHRSPCQSSEEYRCSGEKHRQLKGL
jgi:hypothetical protein